MLDWDKLRIFHTAAESGSFTHAAEKLNMSQSAVSRQISALEEDLNLKLFIRHARGLVLTAAALSDLQAREEDEAARTEAGMVLAWLLPITKNFAAEAASLCANDAIQVLGGAGYTREWPAERYLRDARVLAIYEGTSGMQALDLALRRGEFFSIVGEAMRERILLVMAKRAGRWIAGAINFLGSEAIYGRNWGAVEHHPFLHFELCYYQAIDFAIQHKLARVEAGAQGEHKLMRGYLPVTTYSAHFIANAGLRRAVAEYLARERAYVEAAGEELAAAAPFRKDLIEQE